VDTLPDFDRQRLEDLKSEIHEDLITLRDIDRQRAVIDDPLGSRRLRQQAERIRENYNRNREEYAGLLRKAIPAQFAHNEQILIQTIVQRLNADQLLLTYTALQEVDRAPDDPELAQLLAAFIRVLPSVQ
jgi:hypothetical protein